MWRVIKEKLFNKKKQKIFLHFIIIFFFLIYIILLSQKHKNKNAHFRVFTCVTS